MTFENLKALEELSESDYKLIGKLADNRSFSKLRDIIEGFQIKRSYNLITGTEREKGDAIDELKDYRGGMKLWKKVMDIIDNSEDYINAINEESESKENENKET